MLSNLFVIYLLFILIPNVLNLGFGSYEITKKGSIGWFYTANEVGAIISILMPFYLNEIINKKKQTNYLSINNYNFLHSNNNGNQRTITKLWNHSNLLLYKILQKDN